MWTLSDDEYMFKINSSAKKGGEVDQFTLFNRCLQTTVSQILTKKRKASC